MESEITAGKLGMERHGVYRPGDWRDRRQFRSTWQKKIEVYMKDLKK